MINNIFTEKVRMSNSAMDFVVIKNSKFPNKPVIKQEKFYDYTIRYLETELGNKYLVTDLIDQYTKLNDKKRIKVADYLRLDECVNFIDDLANFYHVADLRHDNKFTVEQYKTYILEKYSFEGYYINIKSEAYVMCEDLLLKYLYWLDSIFAIKVNSFMSKLRHEDNDFLNKQLIVVKTDNEKLQLTIDELTTKNQELAKTNKSLSDKNLELTKLNAEIITKHDELNLVNYELKQSVKTLEDNNKDLLNSIDKLESTNEKLGNAKQELEQVLHETEDAKQCLEKELKELNTTKQNLEDKLAELDSVNEDLASKLAEKQKLLEELEALNKQLTNLKNHYKKHFVDPSKTTESWLVCVEMTKLVEEKSIKLQLRYLNESEENSSHINTTKYLVYVANTPCGHDIRYYCLDKFQEIMERHNGLKLTERSYMLSLPNFTDDRTIDDRLDTIVYWRLNPKQSIVDDLVNMFNESIDQNSWTDSKLYTQF